MKFDLLGLGVLFGLTGCQFLDALKPAPSVSPSVTPTPISVLWQDLDGRKVPPSDVILRRRPMSLSDDQTSLTLENYRIHDLTDRKAVYITTSFPIQGQMPVYSQVTLRNFEIYNVNRVTPGLHIDFLFVEGSAKGVRAPDVTLENISVHDGNGGVMPLLLKDGSFHHVQIKNYKIERAETSAVIAAFGDDRIESISIEDSPGLHINIQCDPGKIGPIEVLRSPGATIQNARDGRGVLCDAPITVK